MVTDNRSRQIDLLLGLLPAVVNKPGITVDELAERFGVAPNVVYRAIDFLYMVGMPPFGPDDYIDIWTEGKKVYTTSTLSLRKPINFNIMEAVSLLLAGQMLGLEDIDAPAALVYKSILAKVTAALNGSAGDRPLQQIFHTDSLPAHSGGLPEEWSRAAEKGKMLQITYFDRASAQTVSRAVVPTAVISRGGKYLLNGENSDGREINIDLACVSEIGHCDESSVKTVSSEESGKISVIIETDDPALLADCPFEVQKFQPGGRTIVKARVDESFVPVVCRRAVINIEQMEIIGPPEVRGKVIDEGAALLAIYGDPLESEF